MFREDLDDLFEAVAWKNFWFSQERYDWSRILIKKLNISVILLLFTLSSSIFILYFQYVNTAKMSGLLIESDYYSYHVRDFIFMKLIPHLNI